MDTNVHELFLRLVRLGIGLSDSTDIPRLRADDWAVLKGLAERQGLSAVVIDGIEKLNTNDPNLTESMPKMVRLQWIGEVLAEETRGEAQREAAVRMAELMRHEGIRTYVLKGEVVAECYPKPEHRVSVDLDCFLCDDNLDNVWERGNKLIEEAGYEVKRDFYKNSTFFLPGLTVENHRFLTPFRGNKRLKSLERLLQRLINENRQANTNLTSDIFPHTYLWRPPVMVSALFLIEHAYSHFLHEGLTWRMVLDWQMFIRKHGEDIDWKFFEEKVDEFGFRRFYEVYRRLGELLVGDDQAFGSSLSVAEKRMLEDIWAPLDLHETVKGWRGKLALAGNTWRARWKYRYFTDMSWVKALWIQAHGVLFEKGPIL